MQYSDGVARIHQHLRLIEEVDAVRGIRAAVDLQDDRERAVSGGLGHPAVDRIAVAPVDRDLGGDDHSGRHDGCAERRHGARRAFLDHDELAERLRCGDSRDDPAVALGVTRDLDIAAEHLGDLTRPRDAEQAHTPARAVLHEEVVADAGDVAADLAEVDRLGVRETARSRRLEDPERDAGGDEVDALGADVAREHGDRAVAGDRNLADREVRIATHHDAVSRAVHAYGHEHRAKIAPRVLDLIRRRQDLVSGEHRAGERRVALGQPKGLVRHHLLLGSGLALGNHDGSGLVERLGVRRRSLDGEQRGRPIGEVAEPVGVPADAGDVARSLGRGIQPLDRAVATGLGNRAR